MTRRSTGAQRLSQVQGSHRWLPQQYSSDSGAASSQRSISVRLPNSCCCATREHCCAATRTACLLALSSVSQPLATKFHRSLRDPSDFRGGACDALRHRMQNKIKPAKRSPASAGQKGCPPPCKLVERGTARRDHREATSNKSSSRLGAAAHRLRRTRAAPSNDVEPRQRPAALRPLGPVAHQMGARRSRSSTTNADQARDQQTVSEDPAPRPVEELERCRFGRHHSAPQCGRGADAARRNRREEDAHQAL